MTAIFAQMNRESSGQSQAENNPAASAGSGSALSEPSMRARWGGRTLSGLAALFLLFDASMKLLQVQPAIEGTTQLGYPAHAVFGIGLIEIVCLAVYLVPRTAVLGAVLWTGYLGGAIATHVRVESPLFSHTLFPIYVALLLWGGLWLREPRLRALLPMAARDR